MSTISNSRNRVSGLMSGLQTEDLVKAMTANTKSRINSQQQKLQTLQWKQESYRSIIDKISDFKSKYLDILSTTSIKTAAVMKKCNATSSNDKIISATASAGASEAKYYIKSATQAKTAAVATDGAAAEGSIKLDFSKTVSGKSYEVSINLDGAKKTIVFTGGSDAAASKENFLTAINLAYEGSVKETQSFKIDDGKWLKFTDSADTNNEVYHTFEVSAVSKDALGFEGTATSKITKASTLGSICFKQDSRNLIGYDININGEKFHFTDDTTVSEMMNTINESKAGVKMSFSSVAQSFTLETKDTGAGQKLTISQTNGHLLNALFNISTDELGTSTADTAKLTTTTYENAYTQSVGETLKEKFTNGFEESDNTSFKLNLTIGDDNKEFTVDFSGLTTDISDETITQKINQALDGSGVVAEYSGGNLSLRYSDGDKKIVVGQNDFMLEEGATNESTIPGDLNYVIAENIESLSFIREDGSTVEVKRTDGFDNIIAKDLVDSGLFELRNDGTLVAKEKLTAGDDNTKTILNEFFGKETILPSVINDHITKYGENSTLELSTDGINFTTYTSAGNAFTFDGTNISVSAVNSFEAASEEDYITVETEKDVSGLKDLIKGFVEDYNKLLEDLYGETSTKRPKSKGSYYDPLTEEQEEEMSDKEIEKWNENAQKGLLYQDSNVLKFLGDIRGAMSTFVDNYGLYNMGIKLTKNWRDNGKLEIDEAKLESALKSDPDKVANLFTGKDGLAEKLEKAIDKAVSTKTKNYGYLTQLAGQKGTKTDTDNHIYKQIEYIKKIIENLNEKYEKEQERYWSKYTALEKYMANMSQQSATLFGFDATTSGQQQ